MTNFKKTIPEIREELFSYIEQVQDEYAKKGWLPNRINLNNGIIRGLLEVFIYGVYQLYSFLDSIMKQVVPRSATGEWLDMHAENVGLIRKEATKAVGYVEFIRDEANEQNIKIDTGKIVKTRPDSTGKVYRYIVIEADVLLKGNNSINVKVESEDYGTGANATVGAICDIVTPIAGIKSVINNKDWLISEASDRESDIGLYNRYVYKWASKAGVTADAYKAAALSITGVKTVYIDAEHPRGQGTIDIYILGTAGMPTESLIKKVQDAVSKEIIINDDVQVLSPTGHNIDVDIEILILYGDQENIKVLAESYIRGYFSNIEIGEDVIRDKIAANIVILDGVKKINWNGFEDVEILSGNIAVLNSLTINVKYTENI